MKISVHENGSVQCITAGPVRISMKEATLFSRYGTNLYLRKRVQPLEFTELLGPRSPGRFSVSGGSFVTAGNWDGLEYEVVLGLSDDNHSWQWSVRIVNKTDKEVSLDLFHIQDAGLKPVAETSINEYYVSQYLEKRILADKDHGPVICCRQNMKGPTGHPWLMMICGKKAAAASVDGMQFYGRSYRETGIPEGLTMEKLTGEYAGESTVLALQTEPFVLMPGEQHTETFYMLYMPDHPDATSEADLERIPGILEGSFLNPASNAGHEWVTPAKSLFDTAPFLPSDELNDADLDRFFGPGKRHCEYEGGKLLSFFSKEGSHVVLRDKEILADRPHGHIMLAKAKWLPDEDVMSTTAFAYGVFNSHLTQGNTNFNTLLSVCSSQFNRAVETGQRVITETHGRKYLLGVPSAFEMGLNYCRWIYKAGEQVFQVRTWTSVKAPIVNLDIKVLNGDPVKLILTHDFDPLNSWRVVEGQKKSSYIALPAGDSMIAGKFPGARFRINVHGDPDGISTNEDNSLFIIETGKRTSFCMSFSGEARSAVQEFAIDEPDGQWNKDCSDAISSWKELSLGLSIESEDHSLSAVTEILPWFGMNALTHFLVPYGLEQFSGAAWGTRDVAQGPLDLLLSMEKYDAAKQVLRIIFSNQNSDGGWPQWWMFDSYSNIRADSSHGDIFYWCLIALSNYLNTTGDLEMLNEVLPYYHEKGGAYAERTPLGEHVQRLIRMITASFIPGTALVPFGGGDWNDSLQPVSRELARRMISSWTVEMNYQAFDQFSMIYEKTGQREQAEELKEICSRIKTDFNKHLVRDGVVAGYGLMQEDGTFDVLLHPDDSKTGIHYSILSMNRGIISGIFTKEQAERHREIIEEHLKAPDGARLMDRPLKYRGGIQVIFQRAESSTFFGREIGLMYTHEHLRYAESLARTGKAEAFLKALRQAVPVQYREIVPCGDIRQSNCYYSSSDVIFRNRYEADDLYDEVKKGKLTLKGGWRIYSSGPGIFIGLVVSRLLGIRVDASNVILDPVLPKELDGMTASVHLLDHPVVFRYHVKEDEYSPKNILVNGKKINFRLEENLYRSGGAMVSRDDFLSGLVSGQNTVEITL